MMPGEAFHVYDTTLRDGAEQEGRAAPETWASPSRRGARHDLEEGRVRRSLLREEPDGDVRKAVVAQVERQRRVREREEQSGPQVPGRVEDRGHAGQATRAVGHGTTVVRPPTGESVGSGRSRGSFGLCPRRGWK